MRISRSSASVPLGGVLALIVTLTVAIVPIGTQVAHASGSADWQVVAPKLNTPLSVAADASGNYFVTEQGVFGGPGSFGNWGSVVEITPMGSLSVVASGIRSPDQLFVTQNDDVYVADDATNVIDEITPDGNLSTATRAIGSGSITSIAVASDGTIWFIQNSNLYKATSSGTPSLVTLSLLGPVATVLTADDDGNIYVGAGEKLDAVAADGTQTLVSWPTGLVTGRINFYTSIHSDAGGRLWETTPSNGLSGFATSRTYTPYPLPAGAVWSVSPSGDVVEAGTSWLVSIDPNLDETYVPMDNIQGNVGLATAADGGVLIGDGSCVLDQGGHVFPYPSASDPGILNTCKPDPFDPGPALGANTASSPTDPYEADWFDLGFAGGGSEQLQTDPISPGSIGGGTQFGPEQQWAPNIASNGTDNVWAERQGQFGGGQGIEEVAYPSGADTPLPSVDGQTGALAVDGAGDVYVVVGDTDLVEIPAGGSPTTLLTDLEDPSGLAVDSSGNVYIADTGDNQVLEYGGGTVTQVGGQVLAPFGVSFDGQGAVYVSGALGIEELVPAGSPSPATSVAALPGNAQVTVSWQPPASFGTGTFTHYTATLRAAGMVGASCTTSGLTCVISNTNSSTNFSWFNFVQNFEQFTVTVETHTTTGVSVTAPIFVTPVQPNLTMGPQAMDGHLVVAPGTMLNVGYDFTIPGSHDATQVSFTAASVQFQATCASGAGGGSFGVAIPDQTYSDAANSSAWLPSGDQASPLTYQGQLAVPDLCSGGNLSLAGGGTFSALVEATDASLKGHVRWHYSASGHGGGWSGTGSVQMNG